MDASSEELPFPASLVRKELPPGTPEMRFLDMEHLEREVAAQGGRCDSDPNLSPFLVVLDVPYNICEQLDNSWELRKKRTFIDLKENTLIIETMVSSSHELISRRIDHIIQSKIEEMGLEIVSRGSGRVKYGNYVKEPDCSFAPISKPLRGSEQRIWPTVVFEVGFAESENKLAIDAQGWLEADGSQVGTVITIKISKTSQHLIFLRWERSHSRRTTRSTQPSATVAQRVEVWHRDGTTHTSSFLQIPFETMFDRPKNSNDPNEEDIILTSSDLISLAEREWRERGFYR